MLTTPDLLRMMLVATLIGMALVAGLYLSRRQLRPLEYLGWSLLALLCPLLGPFLVILAKPGKSKA
jgi:hypothetical protein